MPRDRKNGRWYDNMEIFILENKKVEDAAKLTSYEKSQQETKWCGAKNFREV